MTDDDRSEPDHSPTRAQGPAALDAPVPGDVAVEVLLRARAGDDRAFAQLIEHYDPALRRLTFLLLHDEDRMRRVLSKAYVKAYRALPRYRRTASPGAWLYRMVYQACVDELRRHHRHPMRPGGARPDVQSTKPGSAFERGLDALPADLRALVVLIDGDELSHAAAGEVLGLSPTAIPVRLHRARAMLRAALAEDRSSASEVAGARHPANTPEDGSEPRFVEVAPDTEPSSDGARGRDGDEPTAEGDEPSMETAPVTHLPASTGAAQVDVAGEWPPPRRAPEEVAPGEQPDTHSSNGGSRRLTAAPTDREAGAAS